MNRVQLQTRLQNHFQNSVYYSGANLNDSIQDGLDEVCAFSGCLFKSATLPFVNNLTYYDLLTLLPDYIGVVAMFNAVTRRFLFPKTRRKFNQVRIDWETAGGTPWYFSPVSHRYVAIYKKPLVPNYGNFYIFYRASAPTLNDSTAIPIPDDHITCLESYCKADLWEQNQEFSKGGTELNTYIASLEQLRVYMGKKDPDRMVSLR
jgi:hypothetical protein